MTELNTPKHILLVADYGKNDLAFKEVQQELYRLAQKEGIKIHVDIVSVDPFHTAQTAAVVAQAVRDGKYDLVYHNTAPRKDATKARVKNDGEPLAYAVAKSDAGKNVKVIGVFSGDEHNMNTFALLPKKGTHVFKTQSPTHGSQFRSRDVFPEYVIAALKQNGLGIKEELHVPEFTGDGSIFRDAPAYAQAALQDAYENQLARHGDAYRDYITVIGDRADAQSLLNDVAAKAQGAEVDFIPLKSTRGQEIEAGFVAAQLALNAGERRTIVILPTPGETLDSAEALYVAKVGNRQRIITSDLKTLAFVSSHLDGEVQKYRRTGRSFKLENDHLAVDGTSDAITREDVRKEAPLPDGITPAYTDGYGNIKLAAWHSELRQNRDVGEVKPGQRVVMGVQVGSQSGNAYIAGDSFAVRDGDMALSGGSSGWRRELETADAVYGKLHPEKRFAELFLRGGSAAQSLGNPQPGDRIAITKLREEAVAPGTAVTNSGALQSRQQEREEGMGK